MQVTRGGLERCMNVHKEYNVPDVFVYGDLWANNIFFKAADDGVSSSDQLLAIIDWQVRAAMIDKAQFRPYSFSIPAAQPRISVGC